MFETFLSIFQIDSLFDPIGISLQPYGYRFAALFGVIALLGIIARVVLRFVKQLNEALRRHLARVANLFISSGIIFALYFLIREQRVAYLTANIVFAILFALGVARLLYLFVYKLGFVYRHERLFLEARKKYQQYLPKSKK